MTTKEEVFLFNEKISEKISLYIKEKHFSYFFQPLKITLRLASPIFLTYPWIMCDGILAHLLAEEILDDLFYQLPARYPLNSLESLPLPLEKISCNNDYFYKASCSRFFPRSSITSHTIHKKINEGDIAHLNSRKKSFSTVRGPFKMYAMTFIEHNPQRCEFYIKGDKQCLEKLLRNLKFIGKKRSLGKGRIHSISVEPIEDDYSLYHPEHGINRPIPLDMWNSPNRDLNILKKELINPIPSILAYKPPYWQKSNHKICLAPGGF